MQASLNIEGLAFCTLEIEGASMPPSMNMIDDILMMDGFGMGLPTLKLILFDKDETLSKDLNLQNGTLIKLRIGKSSEDAPEYAFRVFGWGRQRGSQGPLLNVVALYDAPMFGAGSYSESYEGISSVIMGEMAKRAGLKYEGPKSPTTDHQVWLNLNTTRLSFSEDTAMHGYASENSCMARIVTLDGTLVYKDLFEVLREEPKYTLAHNTSGGGNNGETFDVREAKDTSVSGLFTHYVNYGQKLFMHSLAGIDKSVESLAVPVLGVDVPVNHDIIAKIKERGSRVSYAGYDYGTGPEDGYNLHEFYEQAFYQNVRFLSLFSERVTALVDAFTGARTFQCIDYKQHDPESSNSTSSQDINGRYVLGGKAIKIKKGTKYCEVFYMYRPFITNKGNPEGTQQPKQNAKASSSGVTGQPLR